MAWFLAALLGANVAAGLYADVVRADRRDPEYGRRVESLRCRMREHPGRPVAVVIGSSRPAMGLSPKAWEQVRGPSDPLLFNLSRLGGGPLAAVMTLRRLAADDVRPDVVILEVWPTLLREEGEFDERVRFDPDRLYASDRPFIRDYLSDPDGIEREMVETRLNPVFANRGRWLARLAPSWVRSSQRVEPGTRELDDWGWAPGCDHHPQDPAARAARVAHYEPIYRKHFAGFRVSPIADRAVREAIALARAGGARVAFAFFPESSEFRSWYPLATERVAREYLDALCRELAVPLIDAQSWLDDSLIADGIHPTRVGAATFTRRFGPAVTATFPDLAAR